ncbi:dTDP-4-dehydrorhamnose 3,5-epimerase [Catalinimonas niigatensis]|uniref:dTDP-4-dehydrorhamnose 3,5-epimerase n=1 Tax=Catalinimonas niigatensis TaxID=1397264 RepID=UPI0026658E41|nr:dTDP-4-dehydrorhamnose 3,5-epimerase [Catalinimonas niigatensis]WPP49237.1 dTDP-4-dehydrorhamnose 3,5-epimerase [Catalinimonas niigatensis]
MHIEKTSIEGLVELFPDVFGDERGYFLETYHIEKFRSLGLDYTFLQANQSFSKKGALRGLHFQNAPYQQGKLVRVVTGKVLDVAVDLRPGSPTYGQYKTFVLDGKLSNMAFVPEGFAHGFLTLEDAVFTYQCTNVYHKASESGVIWNDPDLNIDWELEKYGITEPIVSEKDLALPSFKEIARK